MAGSAMALLCTALSRAFMALWHCHGTAACHGSAIALPWHCHSTATTLPWHCHGTAMGFHVTAMGFNGTAMGFHDTARGLPYPAMTALCHFHGSAMNAYGRQCHGTAVILTWNSHLSWHCHDTAMALPLHCHDSATKAHGRQCHGSTIAP